MGNTTGKGLVIGLIILLLSFANTFAQDVIVQEGNVDAAEGTGTFEELIVDSNVLVVNGTTDRVGIGTNSPDAPLHIASDANHIKLENGSYSAVIELEPVTETADSILYLRPSRGKVWCSGATNPEVQVESTGGDYIARFALRAMWNDHTNYDIWQLDNRGQWDTPNYRFSIFHITESTTKECLTILPDSGDVGIGTKTPSKKLDVNGDTNIDGGLTVDELVLPTSAPGSAVAGSIYFDTSIGKVKVYDGNDWEILAFE